MGVFNPFGPPPGIYPATSPRPYLIVGQLPPDLLNRFSRNSTRPFSLASTFRQSSSFRKARQQFPATTDLQAKVNPATRSCLNLQRTNGCLSKLSPITFMSSGYCNGAKVAISQPIPIFAEALSGHSEFYFRRFITHSLLTYRFFNLADFTIS